MNKQEYTEKCIICFPMLLVYGFIYFTFPPVSTKQMLFEVEKLLLRYQNMSTELSQEVEVLCCGKMVCSSIRVCKKEMCKAKIKGKKKKKSRNTNNRLLHHLFNLKVTFAYFLVPSRTPHCESYTRKSVSRAAQGARGARG